MLPTLVLSGLWNVSATTGCGIEGAELDVYRFVNGNLEYAVKKMMFPDRDSARRWAWDNGYLKVYVPKISEKV